MLSKFKDGRVNKSKSKCTKMKKTDLEKISQNINKPSDGAPNNKPVNGEDW